MSRTLKDANYAMVMYGAPLNPGNHEDRFPRWATGPMYAAQVAQLRAQYMAVLSAGRRIGQRAVLDKVLGELRAVEARIDARIAQEVLWRA